MTRKQSDKKSTSFFGNHLEIKPSFMQKTKSLDEVMAEAFTRGHDATVAPDTPADSSAPADNIVSTDSHVIEPAGTIIAPTLLSTTEAIATTEALRATVVESAIVSNETPIRLSEEVARLRKELPHSWHPLQLSLVKDYWWGYAQAWHWLEDQVMPQLDKDSRLTLRHCYRRAFGESSAAGRFFTGQTALAQEVGLSKRRIQDIMEIYHQLGWICKTAHFNRGNRKGTEYEMRLPLPALEIFLSRAN